MLARMNVKPVSLWRELHNDMDNWFSAANSQFNQAANWVPAVDVIEEDDHYLLKADLPGVDAKDIEILFQDNALTIKGERIESDETEQNGYKRIERTHGSFQRTFRLPDNVDADNITAKNQHGVLDVRVPKLERAQRKIEVQ
ncbi:MAG: Hsp20/alpha crystallin family protein [Pseudomonadota bacterium]